MTQRDANKLWEGLPLDMSRRYANTMVFFLLILFYCHLNPLLLIVGMAGIVWQFWTEKYVLLRRHKIPEVVGPHIAMFFANSIPYCLLIWSLAVFGMTMEVSDGYQWGGIFQVILCVIWLLIPVRSILRCLSPDVQRTDREEDSFKA